MGVSGRAHNRSDLKTASPTPAELRLMQEQALAAQGPKTPVELLQVCEEQGATWRRIGETGYYVWGPRGEFKFTGVGRNNRWDRMRAIASARDAGFVVPGPHYQVTKIKVNRVEDSDMALGREPQPTQNYDPPAPNLDSVMSTVNDLQEMVLNLIEQVDRQGTRLDAHGERLTELKRDLDRVKNGVKPLASDKYAIIRDEIMEWFLTMPAGVWFGSRAVINNMGVSDADFDRYHNQLANLATTYGQLERYEEVLKDVRGAKGRGGSYLYRRPVEEAKP